jgi:hypothetical protein
MAGRPNHHSGNWKIRKSARNNFSCSAATSGANVLASVAFACSTPYLKKSGSANVVKSCLPPTGLNFMA